MFPLHWLFDLSFPRTGACRLLGGPGLQKVSRTPARCLPLARVHIDRYSLGSPPAVSVSPGRGTEAPHSLPPGGPPRPARVCPGSRGHCFFPGAQCTSCAPSGVASLFPLVLWRSCAQTPLTFQAECSGRSSSQCQSPQLGAF